MKFFHQLFANLHAVSTSVICIHYIFARPWGAIYLNYKLIELTEKLQTTSGTSPDSTVFILTTFSLLQTGATVPLKGLSHQFEMG